MRIGSQRRPVAFLLDLLVGDGAFHDQHEWIQPSCLGLVPELQEVVAVFVGEYRIVQVNLGQAGNRAQQDVFNAGLGGRGNGDRISITSQTRCDPHNVQLSHGRFLLGYSTVRNSLCES